MKVFQPPFFGKLLAGLILISLGLVGWLMIERYARPQQPISDVSHTEKWKIYVNNELNYSIKYPPNWYTHTDGSLSPQEECPKCGGISPGFHPQATVLSNNSILTLKDFVKQKFKQELTGYTGYKIQSLAREDIESVWVNDVPGATSVDELYVIFDTNKILSISLYGLEDNEISQILSTFKFLDSSENGYVCPVTEGVDCMPGPGVKKAECESDYLQWAQNNCPGFKGVAY